VIKVRARLLLALPTVVLWMTACGNSQADEPRAESEDAASTALELCRSATDGAQVLDAWPTTVVAVRQREGGPAPGHSPAAKPWANLPSDAEAAWCKLQRGGVFVVAAATADGPLVDFMVTQSEPGSYPDGPMIP
jgi:hypothetical protein